MKCDYCSTADYIYMIEDMPAVDVAPVRHGRWVYPIGMAWNYMCSECGKPIGVIKHKYCPNFEVNMDEKENDNG